MRLLYHFVEHTRACEICGKPFKVGGGRGLWNKLTCGPACARENYRRKHAAWNRAHMKRSPVRRQGVVRVCPVCGQPFTLKSSHAWSRILCSRACQEERKRRQTRAWHRVHPDYYRERDRRQKEAAKVEARRGFSDGLPPGFCLECGENIRRVPRGEKRSANGSVLAQWHRNCYARFRYRWTKGLYTTGPHAAPAVVRACVVCGRKFKGRRFGPFVQKVCSEECRKEHKRRVAKAWRERYPEQVELEKQAYLDRRHAMRQAGRR